MLNANVKKNIFSTLFKRDKSNNYFNYVFSKIKTVSFNINYYCFHNNAGFLQVRIIHKCVSLLRLGNNPDLVNNRHCCG